MTETFKERQARLNSETRKVSKETLGNLENVKDSLDSAYSLLKKGRATYAFQYIVQLAQDALVLLADLKDEDIGENRNDPEALNTIKSAERALEQMDF